MNRTILEEAVTRVVESSLFDPSEMATYERMIRTLNSECDLYGVTFRVADQRNQSITFAASKPGEEDMRFEVTYKVGF